ncbi:MAG: hypothetical protein EOP02_22980 [Proteobacteria bacterium]|nr:MAG: hypothetical protein EOP02_22980 [Pseudomonadota bacterium]
MNHKLFNLLSGLAITCTLLVAGLMPGGQATRLSDGSPGDVVETLESEAIQAAADEAAPAPRKHRRGRASLSMPYFSFAQSLRPQG